MDKLIKDSYLGSINTKKNKNSLNNENLNYSKKLNSHLDENNNECTIKYLKTKIKKQEIDLKFLHEKLKKLQGENTKKYFEISNKSKKESKLNSKEVKFFIILG